MSTTLENLFEALKSQDRAALIGYIPAGFPSKEKCFEVIKAMVDGGVDAIEIGFPYSDPVMDGPIIQAAADISLKAGTGAADVFETLAYATSLDVPAVVMTYWNPIERYGVAKFATELARNGGSGVITPDLTIEESTEWAQACADNGINRIYVVAPSTSEDRLPKVTSQCSGFVYAASLMGVTGTRTSVSSGAKDLVAKVRATTGTPVSVGLGVSTQNQAAEVAEYADGVIVGSAFIRLVLESADFATSLVEVKALAAELALGVRRKQA